MRVVTRAGSACNALVFVAMFVVAGVREDDRLELSLALLVMLPSAEVTRVSKAPIALALVEILVFADVRPLVSDVTLAERDEMSLSLL